MNKIKLLDSLEKGDSVTIIYNAGSNSEISKTTLFLGKKSSGNSTNYYFKDSTGKFEFSQEFLLRKNDLKIELIEEFD